MARHQMVLLNRAWLAYQDVGEPPTLHRLQSLPRFQAASYTQGSLKIKSAYLSPSTTPKSKASHAAIAQATHSPNPKGSLKTKKRISGCLIHPPIPTP